MLAKLLLLLQPEKLLLKISSSRKGREREKASEHFRAQNTKPLQTFLPNSVS